MGQKIYFLIFVSFVFSACGDSKEKIFDASKKILIGEGDLNRSDKPANKLASVGGNPIQNPSGDCHIKESTNNGARQGYHSPASSDVYMPDCKNPLKEELWRVFAKKVKNEEGKSNIAAYIIPRPDRLGIEYGLCNGRSSNSDSSEEKAGVSISQIKEIAGKYGLCDERAVPKIINNMTINDALVLTNFFHSQIKFESRNDSIYPWVPDTDILAACELVPISNSTATNEVIEQTGNFCAAIKGRCSGQTCTGISISPSAEVVKELVPTLNELYGVEKS